MRQNLQRYAKTFGPGILFASTAIGVSHLVQSTRAGAEFGLALVGFVIIANLFKYPFFEYSSRYANVTGTSIIDGYKRLGRHALVLYLVITVASMFFVTAAVGFVTAGFLENLFQIEFLGVWTVIILFLVCTAILMVGRYRALDSLIKVIGSVLIVSTILAFAIAMINGPVNSAPEFTQDIWTKAGILFVIALMGWMPMPVDISSWHSLWTVERIKQTQFRPKLKETLFDFNSSYIFTSILAVLFLVLGAFLFFGSGEELPDNNSVFANMIVSMYTITIGEWSYMIIAIAAFSVMFGTTLAVFDGYARSLGRITNLLSSKEMNPKSLPRLYLISVLGLSLGSIIIILQFKDSLTELVDFATIVSFLIAPVIAVFNHRLVTGKHLSREHHPPKWLKGLGYAGIVFLIGFAMFFAISRFL
ncbi:MAG: divalent metal cation transporter [Nitrosopumilaceae archaeon]|nr:divalent metal cation transporter [Nitrosopumilaceae archaeon]NIU02446.1 divalent metal cation transporter [Nitrosopumilaceae archaeon]NIU88907.1 divalent metal cation transporter [Nitrosopumilaceae archaeon]NIV67018.1 divalent metal cation transporter [Nitrosopumilaceae archaeon]NIX63047.1 divalent metal cation transporter [Nitrosopumilaceae archaeon]